jgi:hypothetical protein
MHTEEEKLATDILYDCEALTYLRFCHIGCYFLEPSDYHNIPIRKVQFYQEHRNDGGMNKKGKHHTHTHTLRQCMETHTKQKQTKQTPWPLVRERTIPTDRPPLVNEI